MKHYKIISSNLKEALIEDVNECLDSGWEVTGSLVVNYDPNIGDWFYQPIVHPGTKGERKD